MSLTGRLVGAEDALTWGLVNRVVKGEDLLATARETARQIAELDPEIAAEYLALYRDNAASTLAEAARREHPLAGLGGACVPSGRRRRPGRRGDRAGRAQN
ncbi:enoyl-CoA hydratase-related protein [Streptomyces sp. INA 01156]